MSDIAMCNFESCPKSKQCYRYMAIPNSIQCYAEFKNICNKDNDYEWFWEVKDNYKIRKEDLNAI